MLKIKNKYVTHVYDIMDEMELGIMHSRKRTKFIDPLIEYYQKHIVTGRQAILDTFAEKDEEGKVIYGEGNSVTILAHNQEPFTNEMEILENECYYLEVNEATSDLIKEVYKMLTNEENIKSLKGDHAKAYDELCTAIEDLKLD
jgi:hypothetical protein